MGTQGIGFVDMRPFIPFNDIPVANLTAIGYANNFYITGPTGPTLQAVNSDSPYSSTSPGLFREYRLVGAGIRVRYIGTELNRSGRVILYRQPGKTGIPSVTNGQTFLSNRSAATAPSTRSEECVTYVPASPSDLFYIPTDDYFKNPTLLIYVDGAVPGTSYEFELVQYFEFVGTNLPMTSKSHSDPVGMAAVTQSIPARVPVTVPAVSENNQLQRAHGSLMETMSGLIPTLVQGGATVLGGMLGGPGGARAGMALGGGLNQLLGPPLDYANYSIGERQSVRIDEID